MNIEHVTQEGVVLCVCTFRRPGLLVELLPKLVAQIQSLPTRKIRLLVIDNDDQMTARPIVSELRQKNPDAAIEYISMPKPGVGNARNAAFTRARPHESLIFFDDDQQPCENWLSALLAGHEKFSEDILVGPVVPVLPDDSPSWAKGAWAWGQREMPDGTIRQLAGFGNILFPPNAIASGLCRVPDDFLRGMGEDTLITGSLTNAGFVIRQVAEARAHEPVAADRLSVDWIRKRAQVSGETWVRVVRYNNASPIRLAFSMLKLLVSFMIFRMRAIVSSDPTSGVRAAVALSRLQGYVRGLTRRR